MISRVTEALSKVKGSMGSHERHALPGVIGDDLLRFGKLPLCLFICIIFDGGDRGNHGAPYPFTDRSARTNWCWSEML
ncbi:cell division protein FtsL [Escherichia coli]|uniref:Cell division protein FtsL n=1 Tax=Escherichia coli TaxID=562 RepID=A0A376MRZ7_ECOLX|nr:cell division protein FtsL [Escherichia coli]